MNARITKKMFVALVVLQMAALATAVRSQQAPAIDPSAVFKTIIPHQNAIVARPGGFSTSAEGAIPDGFGGSAYNVGPTVTPTTTVPEAEEHIAVDPNNFMNLVAMISDFSQNGGFNTSKFAVSKNNGASWTESFVPLTGGFPTTAEPHVWQANSDPVVAIDKLGNVFLANLYLQVAGTSVTNDGLYVCSATLASGPAFTTSGCHPVKTSLTPSSNLEDKPWIAVDNSTSTFAGNVYASWTHFTSSSDMVFLSRSTDHGVTWSKPIQISSASQNGALQGSQVAVGPAGEVYVAYEVFLSGGKGQHFIAKSTNGGVSFSRAVILTPMFNNLSFSSTYRDNTFPALAVAPVTGKAFIYDVYTDQPSASSRTEFVRSKTAGGTTFTTPVGINDKSTGQRLMPAVAVDTNGIVHMSWFDTRNSKGSTDLLDIFATFTKNNGTTFAPNARVTTTQITAGGAGFIGDYAGIAAEPNGAQGTAHPVWTSGGVGGTTNGQLQTATLTVP